MVEALRARPRIAAAITNHTYTGCVLTPPSRKDSPLPATDVAAPLIGEAPVNFECSLITALEMSHGSKIIVGEIIRMHIKDEFVDMERLLEYPFA